MTNKPSLTDDKIKANNLKTASVLVEWAVKLSNEEHAVVGFTLSVDLCHKDSFQELQKLSQSFGDGSYLANHMVWHWPREDTWQDVVLSLQDAIETITETELGGGGTPPPVPQTH